MSDLSGLWKRLGCALLVLAMAGCGGSTASKEDPDGTGEVGKPDTETTTQGEKPKKIIPVRRDVKSLEGNWAMAITVQGRDNFIWIMQLTKDASDKFQAELIDTSNEKLEAKVDSIEIDGNKVHLKIKNSIAVIDFQGEFDGIVIRGTLANNPQELFLGRLLPTDATKLSDYVPSALPPAANLFSDAIKAMQEKGKPKPEVILQLAKEHRNSPIALEHVFGLLSMNVAAGFDDATVQSIVDQYLELSNIWGPRMRARAELITAEQLITSGRLPAEALKNLSAAEKAMADQPAAIRARIQMFREEAEVRVSLAKSKSKSAEERAAAYAELLEGLKKQPYNPDVLLALGEYSAANKKRLDAISYYSDLVALPLLELAILQRRAGKPPGDPSPNEMLTRLWTEEYGNPDDLRAHLEKRHKERLAELRTQLKTIREAVPAAEIGNHAVLVEFFSGGQSPDAVATEVAIDALRETYPVPKVIALRYHQHIPGPDGLANQDGEDRFAYYQMGKIPMVVVDGAVIDPERAPFTGHLQASGNAYNIFRAVVDPRMKQSTSVRLELSGKVENEELTIHAAVTGVSEQQLPSLRLRLALVEESIYSPTPNGIREHAMVVREMPGGSKGILAKKGELKFSVSMPAAELQKHLSDYIASFEAGKRIAFPPSVKPPVRGPLFLVGWVQDDKSDNDHPEIGRAILQTAIVPVAGSEFVPESAGEKPVGDQPAGEKPEGAKPSEDATAKPESETPPSPKLPE